MTGFILARKFQNESVVKFLAEKFPKVTYQVDEGKKEGKEYIYMFTQYTKIKSLKETQT